MSRPLVALVLAAGFGTRLAPLTDELPKPLVPVGDQPLLRGILEKVLEGTGADLWVNAHCHHQEIASFSERLPFSVRVSHEVEILGTAGGAARVARLAEAARLLLVNGDIWGQLPIADLVATNAVGLTLAVVPRALGEGTVGFDRQHRVVRLRGEHFGEEVGSGDYMGVAQLGRKCLETLPDDGCLIGDWALPCLRRGEGEAVQAVSVKARFIDVGTPAGYLAANRAWLAERDAPGPAPARERGRAGQGEGAVGSFVGPGARLEPEVRLVETVVGAGAHVAGSGTIERCVVLPGARARAPLRDSIVTPSGCIVSSREWIGP